MQSHILVTRCGRPADMMLLPGILLLLLLLCRVELGRAAPTRPNVLMVIVDDLVCQSASTTAPCQQQHTLCWAPHPSTADSTVQSILGCQLLTDRRVPVDHPLPTERTCVRRHRFMGGDCGGWRQQPHRYPCALELQLISTRTTECELQNDRPLLCLSGVIVQITVAIFNLLTR